MKSFSCEHGGVACSATVTGETEEEVLEKAVAHARDKHGVDLTDSQTLARYAQSLIRDDSAREESTREESTIEAGPR